MALFRSCEAFSRYASYGRSLSVSAGKLARPEPASAPRMTDIGTRRIFNEDHDMIREACRRCVPIKYFVYFECSCHVLVYYDCTVMSRHSLAVPAQLYVCTFSSACRFVEAEITPNHRQ